jgi:D-glycero-D-manno-heptose 1,7-bisphosphate phosphatase
MNYSSNKALFLDRDGVINEDYGHVHSVENFKFIEGIFELCRIAQNHKYLIIVITNQAGIAKGLYSENDFLELTKWMQNQFLINGIYITKTYYCPHRNEDNCQCRKPNPGMLLRAINEHEINPNISVLIGDKLSDIEAGQRAKINKCILYNENTIEEFLNNYRKFGVFF